MKALRLPAWKTEELCRRLDRWTAGDRLFFMSFGLFLVTSLLSTSFYYRYFFGRPYTVMQVLCLAMLAGYEYRNGFLKAQNWNAAVVMGMMSLIALSVSDGNILRIVALMFPYTYCARRLRFERIAAFTLKVSLIVVCIVVFSGYIGIIDNVVTVKAGRVREYLGFRYALFLPGILLNMTALWIYLHRNTMTVQDAAVWLLVNLLVYLKTDSRISFLLAAVLLVAALAMRLWPKVLPKLQWLWGLMAGSFVLCGGFSLLLTFAYNGESGWMRKLNSMLESRLSLGQYSLDNYGIPWFGQMIEWKGNGLDHLGQPGTGMYTYVDNLYIKILQRYGMFFFVLLLGLVTWGMYRLWKRRQYHILLISASVAAHCVLDDLSFALHYNTFWIAIGLVILNPATLADARKKRKPPKTEA